MAISETGSIPTKCIINFLVIGVKIISPSVSTLLNNIYIYIYIYALKLFLNARDWARGCEKGKKRLLGKSLSSKEE